MREKANSPKIIIWDLETSLMETLMFHMQRKFRNFISYNQIQSHWYILCASWKELGSSKVNNVSLIDDEIRFKKNHKDDYFVVKTIADVIRDADILIAHNGDKFDIKMLNTRLAYHNLPPLPKVLTIDTLKQARSIGEFPSNSLDNLANFFGLGRKIKTDFKLWIDCQNGDAHALRKMSNYCNGDVRLNEKIYKRLLPYMKSHPNIADINSRNCPKCNSSHTHKHKIRLMSSGRRKLQFQCQKCGSYFTHSELLPEQAKVRL